MINYLALLLLVNAQHPGCSSCELDDLPSSISQQTINVGLYNLQVDKTMLEQCNNGDSDDCCELLLRSPVTNFLEGLTFGAHEVVYSSYAALDLSTGEGLSSLSTYHTSGPSMVVFQCQIDYSYNQEHFTIELENRHFFFCAGNYDARLFNYFDELGRLVRTTGWCLEV